MTGKILKWHNDVTPISILYDDIYFSTDDGLAESKAVFLDGIDAPEIWRGEDNFTICELGFGTGLNFFNCMNAWLNSTSEDQRLTYYATEKHFLEKDEIKRAIIYPELQEILDIFLDNYGSEQMDFFGKRVRFRLLLGDSKELLSRTNFKADAWFLDGFAPRKNPNMWSEELFRLVATHSNDGARLATFTAASSVRKGLESVGLSVQKRAGFGKKREMITAVFDI